MIQIEEPGLLTTVQDRGRWGSQDVGVPVAGPMDEASHRMANLLVGNPADRAVLEITLAGPSLEFLAETTLAVTGAEFELRLDGAGIQMGRARRAARGSRLVFGRRGAGARAYLAVAGGIDVPPVLGSRSTDLLSGLGGLGGRAIRAGDRLAVGRPTAPPPAFGGPSAPFVLPAGGARVRVMPGREQDRVASGALERFGTAEFTLATDSNRMGYRLRGPKLELADAASLLSSPTPVGTIQVPPSGQPILLMADRQTTGGYVRIATVISADVPLAGQLCPGDSIAFTPCDHREAVAALIDLERRLGRTA